MIMLLEFMIIFLDIDPFAKMVFDEQLSETFIFLDHYEHIFILLKKKLVDAMHQIPFVFIENNIQKFQNLDQFIKSRFFVLDLT